MKLRVWRHLMLAAMLGLPTVFLRAQTSILLNIGDATYPQNCTVAQFQSVGVAGLTGSETISQFVPAFNVGLATPMIFTNGGQVMFMDNTANGGTYAKNTVSGGTVGGGLSDLYLWTSTATARTMTVSNLNLSPGTNYTLYLIGSLPVSDNAEDGLFQPVNTPNITFASTAAAQGVVSIPFTTSVSYSNANVLQFTWAKTPAANGSFQGLAIVPGAPPTAQTLTLTNGVAKFSALTNTTVNMSGKCELWATNSFIPLAGCTINLNSADSWLFLPNIKPSAVVASTYLRQVWVNGVAAVAGSNVRVVQYGQNGAIIIPQSATFQPLTVFTGVEFSGTATAYSQYSYYTGAAYTNVSSFKLKRGYQAVFAQSADGKNYSKCYVAQDGDLEVGILPATLGGQVQFIYVTPWRWTSKKGIAGNPPYTDLNVNWWYDWNIDSSSSRDLEYVAIRQTQYWPGMSQNWQSLGINTVLGYNEPDSSSQANMSVATAISSWGDPLGTGLRVGSPACTDGGVSSWLIPFVTDADAAGLRVDFVAQHYYQGHNPADAAGCASQMYNFLLNIWNNTHRPIWVTEWNNGANWTDSSYAAPTYAQQQACITAMVNMLESTPFVERYALYNWVEDTRSLVTSSNTVTLAGTVYSNTISAISYSQTMPDNGTRGIAQFLFNTNTLDTSGYYNNAMAVSAPVFSTGHSSAVNAIALDGANNYVQLPANIAKGSAFTFAAWVYWNGGAAWQRIFDFGNDTSHYLFLTPNSGSTLRFAIANGGSEQRLETGVLASGSWQHVAVTLSNNVAVLYVNGAQVASSSSFTNTPASFTPIKNYLGKSQFADPLFSGKFDEVEIADFAMSAAQISALYNSTPSQPYAAGIWTNNASGNWGTGNNWSSGWIASGAGFMADFSTLNITADRTVTLDSSRTNGALRFGDTSGSQNWILSGASTLTLDGGGANVPLIAVNQNTATISTPLVSIFGFSKTGSGTLSLAPVGTDNLGNLNLKAGKLNITAGTINITDTSGSNTRVESNSTLTVSSGATLNIGGSGGWWPVGVTAGATGAVVVAGGTINVTNSYGTEIGNESGAGMLTISSGTFINNDQSSVGFQIGAGSMPSTVNLNGGTLSVNSLYGFSSGGNIFLNGGTLKPVASNVAFWNSFSNLTAFIRNLGIVVDSAGFNVTVTQPWLHSTVAGDSAIDGGLRKNGTGTLTLNGTNTYTGNTTINVGTLALGSTGSIANSRNIAVAGGALFDVSAVAGEFTLGAVQTLSGSGTVNGTVSSNGIIAPGTGGTAGTLTFNNSPVLNGVAFMKVSRSSGVLQNDQINLPSGALTYGGTLTVSSSLDPLQAGDTFQLFSATSYGGSFAVTNLPSLNPGLAWSNSLAANGSIAVIATVSLMPTNIICSVSGTNLILSWPQDHTGWRLQVQTNAVAVGLGTNWTEVPGSSLTNNVALPIDSTLGNVFYRLVY